MKILRSIALALIAVVIAVVTVHFGPNLSYPAFASGSPALHPLGQKTAITHQTTNTDSVQQGDSDIQNNEGDDTSTETNGSERDATLPCSSSGDVQTGNCDTQQ